MLKRWFFLLNCCWVLAVSSVTIYQIQFTTNAGNGTYPSPYANQVVTTQGIVTANGFLNNRAYFISMPEGGAWRGIMVYDSNHFPTVGDNIQITGTVTEYYGLTEITNITSYQTLSTGNPLPNVSVITTAQANSEAYEGCFIQVENVSVTQTMNQYNEWYVSDGSGICMISDGFMDMDMIANQIVLGNTFSFIRGFGHYSYGNYSVNPRNQNDLQLSGQQLMVSIPSYTVQVGSDVQVVVNVSGLTYSMGYSNYHFQLGYNTTVLGYLSYSIVNTLSDNGTMAVTPQTGNLTINYQCNGTLEGNGPLIRLNFNAYAAGSSPLTLSGFTFNSTTVQNISNGVVTVTQQGIELMDTLRVIQKPLLNIPAIVIPNEELTIECVAPQNTTGWTAQLRKNNININLPIISSQYTSLPARWIIKARIPQMTLFELYDLRVTASGGIDDKTTKSVYVLPYRKTNYYFAHVTDMHLPTHIFYPDTGYDTDSTEVIDFREVIKDLNIIRPEFVLNTGDLVNQGELEEYANVRSYSKAKRILQELEVPSYLVAGNHDIGGWPSTAPPAGTAMKNWWRFFGWSWLNNSNPSYPYHTQDYSFDYGNAHYIGLMAYDNYDNYLPNIFGSNSFTNQQMSWLQSDLLQNGKEINVLFHHYDFDNELHLTALNIDLALWGHIHYNSGSLTVYPYNLATDGTCDGDRAYRIIRVNGNTITPYATLYTGSQDNNINLIYYPHNNGTVDSVRAVVNNYQPISFENALVKFKMPSGNWSYQVTNGILEQVDRSGSYNICYVRVNLTANSTINVSIKQSGTPNQDETQDIEPIVSIDLNPNPCLNELRLDLTTRKPLHIKAEVYDLKGKLVNKIAQEQIPVGNKIIVWNGKDKEQKPVSAGIYLIRVKAGTMIYTKKLVKL